MKKTLFIFAVLLMSALYSFSQSTLNLVIFSEDGDQFFAYVNGIKQNDKPESNVKITNLASPNVSLRIEFSDKALTQLKQNMSLEQGFEHTAKIKRDMKKQLKLTYFGQVPIDEAPATGSKEVVYHSAENSPTAKSPDSMTTNNTITSTSTNMSTQTFNGTDNGAAAVNITVGGAGISLNVSGMDPNATNVKTTTSTTVTSTNRSSSNFSSSSAGNKEQNERVRQEDSKSVTAKTGCRTTMAGVDFNKMKQSIESKPFSDSKMSTAKVATKNACLSVSQVKAICVLFDLDDDKLMFAKFAYDYCTEKAKYYLVSEVFSFSTSTDELNQFLEEK